MPIIDVRAPNKAAAPLTLKAGGAALWLAALCLSASPVLGDSFGFETGYEGWIADFADYPVADSANWHLRHGIAAMPGVAPAQQGLRLAGDNFSDDLFLYVRKRFTGLVPNAEYRMEVLAGIVTGQCPDCGGGDSFYLKAGATAKEPKKAATDGMFRMDIDKGNQARGGAEMDTLGFVHHDAEGDMKPHLVRMGNAKHPFRFRADANGGIWVAVGVESAFETPVIWDLADLEVRFTSASGIRQGRAIRTAAPLSRDTRTWDAAGRLRHSAIRKD